METAITKFKNHPNVTFIKNIFNNAGANFSFQYVSLDETSMEIYKPNPKKAIQATDIPNKVIKFSYFLYHNFNNSLSNSPFPAPLEYADVRPTYKKDNKTDKTNYRPISILPNISKVYERLMHNQLYPYFDNVYSKIQSVFRKGYTRFCYKQRLLTT